MITNEIKIRIRYGHTDRMGYCYYGNYPQFYEAGRTEMMRDLGMSYKQLEDSGILMPVMNMNIQYLFPAFYDDELTVKTMVKEMPKAKITFYYEITNQEGKLINKGETVLVFLSADNNRPVRAPQFFIELLEKGWEI